MTELTRRLKAAQVSKLLTSDGSKGTRLGSVGMLYKARKEAASNSFTPSRASAPTFQNALAHFEA